MLPIEAADLVRQGRLAEALELLESMEERIAQSPHALGLVELLRARLFEHYRAAYVEGRGAPRLAVGTQELLRYNLPAGAGFLVSMLDGQTPVADLIALSGADPFATLRTLHRLVEARIVEVTS
jgi:hypothetical protein